MKYCVIFAFLKKDGSIETDKDGNEHYHSVYVEADNEKRAEKVFWKQENFTADKPEIISILKLLEEQE